MIQNMQLHIPEPCHEDWNKMTPTAQGRHCQSCCKQVVDFTTMSDQQIISYLTKTSGETCGRFRKDQLEKPLRTSHYKPWKWIMAGIASLFFFFNKVQAQKKEQCDPKRDTTRQSNRNYPRLMGKIAVPKIKPVKEPVDNHVNEAIMYYPDTTRQKQKSNATKANKQ